MVQKNGKQLIDLDSDRGNVDYLGVNRDITRGLKKNQFLVNMVNLKLMVLTIEYIGKKQARVFL